MSDRLDPMTKLKDVSTQIPAHLLERQRASKAADLGLRDCPDGIHGHDLDGNVIPPRPGFSVHVESDINRPDAWEYERAHRTKAMNEINVIVKECWQTAEDHGWHEAQTVNLVAGMTFGDRIALITSEASEALEAFRDGHAPTETWYEGKDGTKPCGVPSELADVIIRVFDVAEVYGIDISAALAEKMSYNKTRPYRHGGKTL